MSIEIFSKSERETQKIGKALAQLILENKIKKRILALVGELGSGKTTFLKGFAKGLGIKEKIISPTFIIFRRFPLKKKNFQNFYHLDCFRIKKPKEILQLGFQKILKNPQNLIAIEWADKIQKSLGRKTLWIFFEVLGQKERKIKIQKVGKLNFTFFSPLFKIKHGQKNSFS